MHILVTGGAGFIGSHLAEALLKKRHRVSVLDDLSTGSYNNIKHLLNNKKFSFTKGSVLNRKRVAPLIHRADQVYHLAAAVGVKLVVDKPLQSMITNIEGTKNVLDLALKKKTPVLIASTSEVYGKSLQLPFREDGDRVYGAAHKERWGYALAKATDELMGILYYREKELPTVVVRYFNTTGPRQSSSYGMVVPTFVRNALQNRPLSVHGTGKQVRSFSYVDDIVRGSMLLLNNKKAYGELFNLGSDEPITIGNLAKKVLKLTGSKSKILYISYSQAYNKNFEDTPKRVADISKARHLVGYKPNFNLDDILNKVIEYQKKELKK